MYEQERLGSSTGYFLQLLAGVGWTSLPALPLIRQPTLILAGNDDPIIPLVNARIMRTLLPHASLHVYDDGHLGLLTAADELGPLVSRLPDLAGRRGRLIDELTTRLSRPAEVERDVHDHVSWPPTRAFRCRACSGWRIDPAPALQPAGYRVSRPRSTAN